MKKNIFVFLAIILLSVFLVSCSGEGNESDSVTLYVYNWGEYISDGSEGSMDVNAEFENYCKEVLGKNVTVNYSTYASNEDLYAKLSSGAISYDVVFPSDYMVARLIADGLVQKFDPASTIENYQYIDDNFKNLYYDPENMYSIPYTFGTVGIIYNTEIVDEDDPDLLAKSWNLMWSEKYAGNILQFNNPRDGFMTAQCLLGYDVNSTDEQEWVDSFNKLKDQKSIVQGYVMDEIFNKMKGGSAAISSYYAGDYFTMYVDNELLSFYHPVEGTNVFVDAMCIPTSCQNLDLAKEYINFILSKDVAIEIAEYICYASPNVLVRNDEDYAEYMTSEIHPDAMSILYDLDLSKMEYYHDLPDDTRDLMNSLWEDLKIESTIGSTIYVICGIIIFILLAFLVCSIVIRKRRRFYFEKYSVK